MNKEESHQKAEEDFIRSLIDTHKERNQQMWEEETMSREEIRRTAPLQYAGMKEMLALKPLIQHPEIFDDSFERAFSGGGPTPPITENTVEEFPELQERYRKEYENFQQILAERHQDNIDEDYMTFLYRTHVTDQMNPFRVNSLELLLSPSMDILTRGCVEEAQELLENYDELVEQIEPLMKTLQDIREGRIERTLVSQEEALAAFEIGGAAVQVLEVVMEKQVQETAVAIRDSLMLDEAFPQVEDEAKKAFSEQVARHYYNTYRVLGHTNLPAVVLTQGRGGIHYEETQIIRNEQNPREMQIGLPRTFVREYFYGTEKPDIHPPSYAYQQERLAKVIAHQMYHTRSAELFPLDYEKLWSKPIDGYQVLEGFPDESEATGFTQRYLTKQEDIEESNLVNLYK